MQAQHSYSEWSPSHLYGAYNPYWQNVIISYGQMILFIMFIRQVGDGFLTSQLFFFPNQQLSKDFVLSFPKDPRFQSTKSRQIDVDPPGKIFASIFHGIFPWDFPWIFHLKQVVAWAWWPLEHPWRCCHASARIRRFHGFRGGVLHGETPWQSSVISHKKAKNTILNLNFMYKK